MLLVSLLQRVSSIAWLWNYLPLDLRQPNLSEQPFQTVAEDVFIWALRPTHSVKPTHFKCALEILKMTVSLHWLCVPERIQFKIAVLMYRVLHGDAPQYLGPFTSTADVPGRRALRSAGTNRLVVPPVRLSTVGSRAFPVTAAAQIWNSLLEHIVSAPRCSPSGDTWKRFYCNNLFVYSTLVDLVVISVT